MHYLLNTVLIFLSSAHIHAYTHTTTHIQPFNFCNGKVTWCLLTESIINMVKCILLFHVFVKSYQTNEFPYLPTILNARLNIPCLKKLFIWFYFIRFSIFRYALDLVDSYAKIMIKIGGSKFNTRNGITCHTKNILILTIICPLFFKIR